jgi:hypothetical protein
MIVNGRLLRFGLLLPGACAAPSPPLAVVPYARDGACRYEAKGRSMSLDELVAAARAWRGRAVRCGGGLEAPYKCLGGAIFALQRAGVGRIGFVSEPPGPE